MASSALGSHERIRLFLRAAVPDFVLALAVSVALVYVVSYAFYSAPGLRGNVLFIAAVDAVLLLAMYAGSWSKRVLPASIAATVVVAAVTLGLMAGLSTDALVAPANDTGLYAWNDSPGNLMTFGFVLVVVPIAVYLLSRRTVGLVVLTVASVLCCGVVQWLYRDALAADGLFGAFVAATFFTLFAIVVMYIFQTYRKSVYQAKRAKRTAFGYATGYAACISLVCVAVGAAVFYGVLAGLGLPTIEIKPFQDEYSQPVIYYTGTYDPQQIEGDDTSDETNDQSENTDQNTEGGDESQQDSGESSGTGEGATTLESAYDATNWNQSYHDFNYFIADYGWVLAVVAAVAVAAFVLFWRYRRTLRIKRLEGKPYSYRVWFLYDYLSSRLARLGYRRRPDVTPMEFALGSRRALSPFAQETDGVDFVAVTDAFQKVGYGMQEASAEDYEKVLSYYRPFFKNARKHVGPFKWLFKFWRI